MLSTHIVRLGTHSEKDYLLRAYAWFDEVVLNANLVQAASGSLAIFLWQLRDNGRSYFIDPVTYAFALSPNLLMKEGASQPSRSNLKRTFKGLASVYGRVIDRYAGEKALVPADLASSSDQDELCSSVLKYQKEKLNEALLTSSSFLMDEAEIEPLMPTRLVAPYFHLFGNLEWLECNISLASKSCAIEPDTWIPVCVDSRLLDSTSDVQKIVEAYRNLDTPGYLLWATAFEEERATEGQIKGLRKLISDLSDSGKKSVINMFGGYFSCLLAEYGLTGVSHGMGYGERRDIEPVLGGGLPPAKYYLPATHRDIRMDQFVMIAARLDPSSFSQDICGCVICEGLLKRGLQYLIQQYTSTTTKIVNGRFREIADPQVYRLTRFHYLSNKHRDFQRVRSTPYDELLDQLDSAYQRLRVELGPQNLMYLLTWRRALA